jgi:hypothetical protein
MSSVVISGDTSGTVTVTVPAVAGTNTATLPAATGTVMVSGNMPAFSAYLPTANQSVTTATWTKVALSAETFDTNNNFDSTTNYRFTPTVAGYYQISGQAYGFNGSSATTMLSAIYKNGSEYQRTGTSATVLGGGGFCVSSIIFLNGSTDYVELFGFNASSSTPAFNFSSNLTYFNGCLLRSS